jgi:hypothetical protein
MVDITYQVADDGNVFAHIWSNGGMPFGKKARYIREAIPPGVFVTVPSDLQPGITYYLTKHCGFKVVGRLVIDPDLAPSDILLKVE